MTNRTFYIITAVSKFVLQVMVSVLKSKVFSAFNNLDFISFIKKRLTNLGWLTIYEASDLSHLSNVGKP